MKDRIKQLMESQHMNQQSFAACLGIAPATINSILQERTRPTLNTVDAIRKKFPTVNINWLMFGEGQMFEHEVEPAEESAQVTHAQGVAQQSLNFVDDSLQTSVVSHYPKQVVNFDTKKLDKSERKITEIRVFYDDQTWESFVPKK